jgi:serine/threonine protein kinase
LNIIGRGGFGKVWKVYSRKYKSIFAMKEMSKTKIIDKRSEKSVKAERDLLEKLHHPFIINMHFSFQDTDHLYIAMDLLTGGDLRYQIFKQKIFFEEQTKFIISCIILSLEYIHTNNILHRDLKPENLVFDHKGYLKLTDFGIAKIYRKENNKDTSGTPGYMAPEVMNAQNHTIAVDYFALGVIGYELMMRKRPYLGKSRKEIKEKIMSHQVQVKKNMVPQGWSFESADFINRLLQRKPANRLGLRGPTEVKEHPWFKGYDWKNLYLGNLKAPFMPKKGDNFDFHYCNAPEKMGLETEERYRLIKGSQKCKDNFIGFYYFNRYANNNTIDLENIKEGKEVLKLVMKNPHLQYLKEEENEESKERKMRIERITNYNYFKETSGMSHKNIFFGMGDEQYSFMKKLPSSRSTATLLKGYNKRPLGNFVQG